MNANIDINEMLALTGRKSIYQPEQEGLIYPKNPHLTRLRQSASILKSA